MYENKHVNDFLEHARYLIEKYNKNGKIDEKILASDLLDVYNKGYDDSIKDR